LRTTVLDFRQVVCVEELKSEAGSVFSGLDWKLVRLIKIYLIGFPYGNIIVQ